MDEDKLLTHDIFADKLLDDIINVFDKSNVTIRRLLHFDSKLLLIKDVDNGYNLLMKACYHDNYDLVSMILGSQFCTDEIVSQGDYYNKNALMIACNRSERCAMEILRSKFCNTKLLEEVDTERENCLMASLATPSIIKHIIESPHFTKEMFLHNTNFLINACQEDDLSDEIMNYLLTHKLCCKEILEDQDDDGWNILHYAAYYRPSIVKVLLGLDFDHNKLCKKLGIDLPDGILQYIDKSMEVGFTYLHILAMYNPASIGEIIKLAHKNTVMIRDNQGRYFYDYLDDNEKMNLDMKSLELKITIPIKHGITYPSTSTKVTCPICYDRAVDAISIPCGHAFCSPCLMEIKQGNSVCPMCKIKFFRINKLFLP
jgi:ankyrin repeat protein